MEASLGQVLKEAREAKGVTSSAAAAATRIKVQHIEALERNDFSLFAAPTYAKGFIRIYAEYLALDPAPLIREYNDLHAPKERAPLVPEEYDARERNAPKIDIPWDKLRALAKIRLSKETSLLLAKVAGGALILFAVVGLFSRCDRADTGDNTASERVQPSSTALIADPPAPYLQASLFKD